MEKLKFIDLKDTGTGAITKEAFSANQERQRENVRGEIERVSRECREDFREGIKNILNHLKVKIAKDNENEDAAKSSNFVQDDNEQKRVEMKTSEADRVYEDLGFKPNLKYGPKSNLRKE